MIDMAPVWAPLMVLLVYFVIVMAYGLDKIASELKRFNDREEEGRT